MNIRVGTKFVELLDKVCFMCGRTWKITQHHALSRHLKPKMNVLIPLCVWCHREIHGNVQKEGFLKRIFKR